MSAFTLPLDDAVPSEGSPSLPRTSPIVVLVVGMAGSGKTTLMHRLNLHMIDIGNYESQLARFLIEEYRMLLW